MTGTILDMKIIVTNNRDKLSVLMESILYGEDKYN